MKTYKLTISGIVQGVGFRAFAKSIAEVMNIDGYVKNQNDGTVLVVANLEDDDKDKFIKELRAGPPSSKVEKIKQEPIDFLEFPNFEIEK